MFCKIHTRNADDRFRLSRVLSISQIIVATETQRCNAISCNADINSGSNEILVRCPDKDTDNLFIFFTFQPPNNLLLHEKRHHIYVTHQMLHYPTFDTC